MYTLVIGNKNYSSWSLRPWVLMTAFGLSFEERLMPFPGGDSYEHYRVVSPSGRVPVLIDGATTVWDSLAIVEYLAERHPGIWPADAQARAWSRSASAEMHSSFSVLRNACGMSCGVRIALAERPSALLRDLARIGELWSEGIERFGGPFLAGPHFTAVDAFFAPVVFRGQTYNLDFGGRSGAYARLMLDHPAMRAWYEGALAETFRDDPHEVEILASGTLTADFRATA